MTCKQDLCVVFGQAYRHQMRRNRLEPADVNRILKIGYSSLWGYEHGEVVPGPDRLVMLADLFDCSVDELLGRKV